MADQNGTNGTNGKKGWIVYLSAIGSLVVSFIALGRSVFVSGDEMGRIEQHLVYIDQRLDAQDSRITRDEERLQPELSLMRQQVASDREAVIQQQQLIEDLRYQLRIKPR